jgi:hypothetical protein
MKKWKTITCFLKSYQKRNIYTEIKFTHRLKEKQNSTANTTSIGLKLR